MLSITDGAGHREYSDTSVVLPEEERHSETMQSRDRNNAKSFTAYHLTMVPLLSHIVVYAWRY